jgi:hypothetical protein
MNLTTEQYAVLVAVRAASRLRCEPTRVNPDGRRQTWSLTELIQQGRLADPNPPGLRRAADGLYRRNLLARRTLHGTPYWAVTEEGLAALAELEAERGTAKWVAAALDLEQADMDRQLAEVRYHAASWRCMAEFRALHENKTEVV